LRRRRDEADIAETCEAEFSRNTATGDNAQGCHND